MGAGDTRSGRDRHRRCAGAVRIPADENQYCGYGYPQAVIGFDSRCPRSSRLWRPGCAQGSHVRRLWRPGCAQGSHVRRLRRRSAPGAHSRRRAARECPPGGAGRRTGVGLPPGPARAVADQRTDSSCWRRQPAVRLSRFSDLPGQWVGQAADQRARPEHPTEFQSGGLRRQPARRRRPTGRHRGALRLTPDVRQTSRLAPLSRAACPSRLARLTRARHANLGGAPIVCGLRRQACAVRVRSGSHRRRVAPGRGTTHLRWTRVSRGMWEFVVVMVVGVVAGVGRPSRRQRRLSL